MANRTKIKPQGRLCKRQFGRIVGIREIKQCCNRVCTWLTSHRDERRIWACRRTRAPLVVWVAGNNRSRPFNPTQKSRLRYRSRGKKHSVPCTTGSLLNFQYSEGVCLRVGDSRKWNKRRLEDDGSCRFNL